MKKRILWVIGIAMVLCAAGEGMVFAKFPESKIRIVVTMAAGGGADLTARMLAQYANPYLGGRLFVENVDGGGGAIGLREAAKAAPDGYTVVLLVTNSTIGPFTIKNFPLPETYEPLCLIATDPTAFAVKADSRFKTIQEFVAYAKAHPDELTSANAGTGAANYLSTMAFLNAAGIKLTLIPYKGSAPAMVAAMGGHVDSVTAGCSEILNYVTGKKLRPLVTFGDTRSRLFPDVPNAKEAGYNVTFALWRGIGIPKGVPEDVKGQLAEAFRKAVENEQFRKQMEQAGQENFFLGPKEAAAWIKKQYEANKALTIKIGLIQQ
jgi:tripartite-type tricarboxylate transporter receptor subunit TctC